MRIITGKAKGIKLLTLEGNDTRPTAEMTKEAVFSMLQFDIEGRVVLDLFSGSGQIGLEALSRGAKEAIMIDSSKKAIEIIRKNAEKTRLSENSKIICEDSLSFLKKQTGKALYDIVFLDPPYASSLISDSLELLSKKGLLKPLSYVVCEGQGFGVLPESCRDDYEVIKEVKHGIAHVTVLRYVGEVKE